LEAVIMWNKTLVLFPTSYYRCILWVVLIAFPILAGKVAYDLRMLESWRTDSASIPIPIAMVYDDYGFWPAVCIVPAIGIVCSLLVLYRIHWLRRKNQAAH
jgi:hypothetical protein